MSVAPKLGNGVRRLLVPAASGALALGLVWALLGAAGSTKSTPGKAAHQINTPPVRYSRDIRPILSDRCFGCHGPDSGTRVANLRLDLADSATATRPEGPPVVPGHPEASELIARITSTDPAVQMPPPVAGKKPLSPHERDLFRRWIAEGARYEPHWSFVPPARPTVPTPRDQRWPRNAIDGFVLASLETRGASPSPPADPATLIRRAFLDLTGLPPTPEELDAFTADQRPDAYERWLDKLMGEEPYRTRYAERMAVPWIDAARYADTCGIHMDAGRQMWLWRDWVLAAFRENMPFDRFLTEQLAGDLLPDAGEAQRIASGFNRNHVTTDEGGAIAAEYLVEYAVDRANTTSSVFLGLTLGCARCHDHKFDPVSQQDYYRFYSFFNSIEEPGLYSQVPDAKRALEPFMVVHTAEQKAELTRARREIDTAKAELAARSGEEDAAKSEFMSQAAEALGPVHEAAELISATSTGGSVLTTQPDGSVLASGKNPDRDEYLLTLRTQARDLRLLALEAVADPSLPNGRIGRAPNGNAVVTAVHAEAVSLADPAQKRPVRFTWAWADVEQEDGDHRVVNLLDPVDELGWALDGHRREGGRVALLLAEQPFGYEGGTEVRVKVAFNSIYAGHGLGRVRLKLARLADGGLERLPNAESVWYASGVHKTEAPEAGYKASFGPESQPALDLAAKFGPDKLGWAFRADFRDGLVNRLGDGIGVYYLAKRIFSPTARTMQVSLGSDDGFALFVNGRQVAAKEVSRAAKPDEDKATIDLRPGENTLVLKVVNVAGPGGYAFRSLLREHELDGALAALAAPECARPVELTRRIDQAWREQYSPGYRERMQLVAKLEARAAEIEAAAPKTMIMKELPAARETFVLTRGAYDKADKSRPVTRGVPAALGTMPADVPQDRLGLARWMTAADNPLVARVAVNRQWEMLFGTGLVRTSEDFGLQGEWPSNPELLDWLAVEFRESGWNVQHVLKLMMTSSTYRQASRVRPELREADPENRLLAWFPRRRLHAEAIRDQALYLSGLLVEQLGGPSVKPYQPDGLWQEVAMIQSNTRAYARGQGNDLWRRSLYTYWKRACPPPAMMAFDAPTRESCTIRRSQTNTPLAALVTWNDEQFVEAARGLAQRILTEPGDDASRLKSLFRRCTARAPESEELAAATRTLVAFRERYQQAPEDAAKLIDVGESPALPGLPPPELAAWTMMANAMMNLSEALTQK